MLNQLKSLTERVGGSNELVDRWLAARNHLLVTYYKMVGIKPGKEPMTALDEQALDDFLSLPGGLPLRRTFQYL